MSIWQFMKPFQIYYINSFSMENAQCPRGAQPSKREESNSDNRQKVIMALRVIIRRYFEKKEKLLHLGMRKLS